MDTAKKTAKRSLRAVGSDFRFGDEEEKGPMVGGGRGGEEKGRHGHGHSRGQRGTMAGGICMGSWTWVRHGPGEEDAPLLSWREKMKAKKKKKNCNMTGGSYMLGKIIGDLQKHLPQ